MTQQREFSMDILRVLACFLVIWQHASENYYISPEGLPVKELSTYTIGYITSLDRCCVALFIIISGYFLLPVSQPLSTFFKRRLARIAGPFVVWGIIYAIYFIFSKGDSITQCLTNIANIPINFGTDLGHMWYVYMLLGLYLLAPVISPWLKIASHKVLLFYLGIWFVASNLPYIHLIFPEIWGECFWNPTPMLYYFTGFVGYFILGFYFRRFGSLSPLVSVVFIIIGYFVTALVYNSRISTAETVASLELSWGECNSNVILMAAGIFSLVKSVKWHRDNFLGNFITDFATKGYAIYLAHVLILTEVSKVVVGKHDSVLLEVPAISLATFILTYLLIKFLSCLPKSRYWLG